MNNGSVDTVVIVGGGTAGWMTAAAFARQWLSPERKLILVESDEIGTVGVGEATIPPIAAFNAMLGLDEREFLRETMGTFKLGIEFVDWTRKGHAYLHPFGQYGAVNDVAFHHYWRKGRDIFDVGKIGDYNLCDIASRLAKMVAPSPNPNDALSSLRYAYHFDAGLYAAFLRRYAEKLGVHRIEGKIIDAVLNREDGQIKSVSLDNGQNIDGDFFIDCSGFRGLIIEQKLEAGFEDWSKWLLCDRAIAAPSQNVGPLAPHTRSTAEDAGWRWKIPLQHRTGNGHVYSSAFMGDDEAERLLRERLEGEVLAEPRKLFFKAGKRKSFWIKNCAAIGLSAGFLEPLESTSIHLIQTGILKLLSLFPSSSLTAIEIDEYNRTMHRQFDYIRDFIILHYHCVDRDDSEFWRYCRSMDVPDALKHKIDLFRSSGRIFRYEDELFDVSNWVAVFLGQNVIPEQYDPRVDKMPDNDLRQMLESIRSVMRITAEQMPLHEDHIKNYRALAT